MKRLIAAFAFLYFLCLGSRSFGQSTSVHYDVVVYGGTASAVMAAVAAKQTGVTVILLSPDKHLGGVTSSGLGWTDIGDLRTIGGLAKEFYHRVFLYYQQPANWTGENLAAYRKKIGGIHQISDSLMWTFEPHVAENLLNALLRENEVPVRINQRLDGKNGVSKENGRIISIKMLHGPAFRGRLFIDATYEGDLMAAAGISYSLGREPNSAYGETIDGIETSLAKKNNLPRNIDPYIKKGDPASGLLPGIQPSPGGKDGQGDGRMQAYCYRVCMTSAPRDRVMVRKPANYRKEDFEIIVRAAEQGETNFWKLDPVPNDKTDSNNASGISTDYIGMDNDYPEGTLKQRRKIERAHRYWTLGLIWTIQHDPRIPESVRNKYAPWGLPRDEFKDNHHFPYDLYVREARRMKGELTMSQDQVTGKKTVTGSIAMGSYTMDSHNTQRYVTSRGDIQNEGDVQIPVHKPYPIPYRCILPKASQCTNLLVPVCLSATHIAYGSIRMEPVFMMLGQSAGVAAALAVKGKTSVQDVPYPELKKRLLEDRQVLALQDQ